MYTFYLDREGGDFIAVSNTQALTLPAGVYNYDLNSSGMVFFAKAISDSKIILDAQQEQILKKISFFWDARGKYQELGFPHKRSILLYGPPGTGKTTIIRAVVLDTIVKRNGIVFECSNLSELPAAIQAFRDIEGPDRPILVYAEDVETRGEETLTVVLDGIQTFDNILFLFTTNNILNISRRLKNRPSRIDDKIEIGWPSVETRRTYINGILPTAAPEEVEELVAMTEEMSIAHIKEIIIQQYIFLKQGEEIKRLAEKYHSDCQKNNLEYSTPEDEKEFHIVSCPIPTNKASLRDEVKAATIRSGG